MTVEQREKLLQPMPVRLRRHYLLCSGHVRGGNIEIRSDSEYAVRIATSRSRGEMQEGNEGNADLWEEFETVLKRNSSIERHE